jgi:methyl-accepting chemotaxis protein
MKNLRYDWYGALAGAGLPLVGTVIEALRHFGSVAPAALLEAHLDQPLLWIMDTTPFVLGGLGKIIVRQHRDIVEKSEAIVRLEQEKRQAMHRTASELFSAARGLLGNVSAFRATTTQTAASVRETTATMNQLSQNASAAALTAETVIGLALQSERTSAEGLAQADAATRSLLGLADDVRVLVTRIGALAEKVREVQEVASALGGAAERAARLAAAELGPAGGAGLAGDLARHAEETAAAAAEARAVAAELARRMSEATAAAGPGEERAVQGARAAAQTSETIRGLAAALRDSARAAREIARVAQQQESGIEQALKAMNEIYLATEDTVASTHQVAEEARSLDSLASSLREVVKS